MKTKKVKDLMIPVEDYPIVSKDASLFDMILVLEEANNHLPPGHHKLRSVLVKDDYGRIIGKVGHLAFLKALEPKYTSMSDFTKLASVGLSADYLGSMMNNYSLWNDTFYNIGHRAKSTKVSDIMHPIKESIEENTSVLEAIHKVIMWQALSIPVFRGERIVGLIRQADLYREVSLCIKEDSEC